MKKIFFCALLILTVIYGGYSNFTPRDIIYSREPDNELYERETKRDILCIMLAYPGYVSGIEMNGGNVYIVMKSGKKVIYDDKKVKNHDQKMANADLEDMMEQIYPSDNLKKLMDINFDPGRFRVYELLKDVYGNSQQRVQQNLANVSTSYGSLQFNRNNNAAIALKGALSELMSLSKNNADVRKALFPSSGTFNYRNIAGTNLLSPHSFGIAIDFARDKRDYWKWASREEGEKRLKSYPEEVVSTLEKYNFIWGGKWGHFDILHFEYRPEIILKAKYSKLKYSPGMAWYEGMQYDNPEVMKFIYIIDNALK